MLAVIIFKTAGLLKPKSSRVCTVGVFVVTTSQDFGKQYVISRKMYKIETVAVEGQ